MQIDLRPIGADLDAASPPRTILRATLLASATVVALATTGLAPARAMQLAGPALLIAFASALVLWSWMLLTRSQHLMVTERTLTDARDLADTRCSEMQRAIDTLDDGLVMLDVGGRVRVANRRFADILDLEAPESRAVQRGESFALLSPAGCTPGVPALVPGHSRFEHARAPAGMIDMHAVRLPDGNVVATFRDVTETRLAEERLVAEAGVDPMTGLPNRIRFQAALAEARAAHERGQGFALLMIDLDRFKTVNDTHGHAAGDTLLRLVAERLARTLRAGDLVARLGGDEFAVIQSDLRRAEDAEALGRRILAVLERPHDIDGKWLSVGASIGVVMALPSVPPRTDLLAAADLALYEAKARGRQTLRIYEHTMSERVERRRAIEADLRLALDAGQLALHYQPIHRLADGSVIGFEALMRWQHPVRGFIPPSDFIPIAEESGLIGPLGAWALRTACEEAARWPSGLRIAVNLSAVQLRTGGFVTSLRKALADSGLPASRLEIEITETTILDSNTETRAHLDEMKAMGVRMSMDDFGTGYSSLSYLRSFAFDKIKIDRSFVAEVDRARDCAAIIETIADLARRLAIATTAEGIETPSQLDHLRRLGCTEGQGYLFSRPMPVAAIPDYLARQGLREPSELNAAASDVPPA